MSAPGEEVAASFRVAGRVQGVGFRFWAQRAGRELGVRGAVRNQEDGSVEVRVCGAPAAVAAFARRLHHGPPGARVDAVEPVNSSLAVPTSGFTIER